MKEISKAPTGIQGLDEITGGGFPKGRPTLLCAGPGCGKTILAMQFLVNGATRYDEPGVFLSFEETGAELSENAASMEIDLEKLEGEKKIHLDHVQLEWGEIREGGQYDLEGLFIRLGHAVDTIQAKRVVLDGFDTLFATFSETTVIRAEMARLFRWLKERDLTAVVTSKVGKDSLSRQGLEEYLSDCVISIEHLVNELESTRRLRVIKYRGSEHGLNNYPFLISRNGMSVLPVTSLNLKHEASDERISSGVSALDDMLGGKGFFRGSSILVSGTAGTGKSSLAAHFVEAACKRGEKALYFSFEESAKQIVRNMKSIGIDLDPWVEEGLLSVQSKRPTAFGLETHLLFMMDAIRDFEPNIIVVDPVNSFVFGHNEVEVRTMLLRFVDFLKSDGITAFFTSLTSGGDNLEQTNVDISSLIDTWVVVRELDTKGERTRTLYVIKSRGMSHSHQVREFLLTDNGVDLREIYVGPGGFLTGSARLAREADEEANREKRKEEIQYRQCSIEKLEESMEAKIALIRAEFEMKKNELSRFIEENRIEESRVAATRDERTRNRHRDIDSGEDS